MKPLQPFVRVLLYSALFLGTASALPAQSWNCTFKPPVITINFGSANVADINEPTPARYSLVWDNCPNDGFYTFASETSDCFYGDWFTLTEDHTPGDGDGNMMLVNGAQQPNVAVWTQTITVTPHTNYAFSTWVQTITTVNPAKLQFSINGKFSKRAAH